MFENIDCNFKKTSCLETWIAVKEKVFFKDRLQFKKKDLFGNIDCNFKKEVRLETQTAILKMRFVWKYGQQYIKKKNNWLIFLRKT